jgi:ubiquinone/menaquinone biosynthesis C-methylase UbiE
MMAKSEFDQFADNYDSVLGSSIPDTLNEDGYFAEYKVALMAKHLGKSRPGSILDFGCGAGRSLPVLQRYFPETEICGYDLSQESLKAAALRAPDARLYSDWNSISERRFDLIFAANVFHHIPPARRVDALTDCRRVLGDSGKMFLFEHNPRNPVTRWIFDRCPFDVGAEMLGLGTALELARESGFRPVHKGYTLFFPRQLAFLRSLESSLGWLPLGAQYFVQLEN